MPDRAGRPRIDVHHHILPTPYVDAVGADEIGSQGSSGRLPRWDLAESIAAMDESGIDTAITSVSSPGVTTLPHDAAVATAREANDVAAAMTRDHPGRFGLFAAVPLRGDEDSAASIDASIAEIGRAYDDLDADGVCLLSNYHGRYLGDPVFAPIHDYLRDRAAVVFIHPTAPAVRVEFAGLAQSMVEFPFETTRTAASLLMEGVVAASPGVRWILSHAGGTLPYLSGRLEVLLRNNARLRESLGGDVNDLIASLYFDTALSADAVHLQALLGVTSPGHVLFGTDYPFGPPGQMRDTVERLDALDLDADVRAGLESDATALFPRFATAV